MAKNSDEHKKPETEEAPPPICVDTIIAGAGMAGVVAALRLLLTDATQKIALVEQKTTIGGRLVSSAPETHKQWAVGLNTVSDELYRFFCNTLQSSGEASANIEFDPLELRTCGFLSGGKLQTLPLEQLFSAEMAKMVGGRAAEKDWDKWEQILTCYADTADQDDSKVAQKPDHSIGKLWQPPRKGGAAVVMEYIANLVGVPDIWPTAPSCLAQRLASLNKPLIHCRWDQLFEDILRPYCESGRLFIAREHRIISAHHSDEGWLLQTKGADVFGPKLVVAQAPWDALDWLPENLWPDKLLSFALKARPISAVSLTIPIEPPIIDADIVLVPAEKVFATQTHTEISFVAPIDFEVSLSAPGVEKAIKRLRRARQKLLRLLPEDHAMRQTREHIALIPTAWAQPPGVAQRRFCDKLKNGSFQSAHLAFCGDAYGPYYNGDRNVMQSVLSACESVLAVAN